MPNVAMSRAVSGSISEGAAARGQTIGADSLLGRGAVGAAGWGGGNSGRAHIGRVEEVGVVRDADRLAGLDHVTDHLGTILYKVMSSAE